jgi:hypothetical protein
MSDYKFIVQTRPYSNVENWWPSLTEIKHVIEAVLTAVETPINIWPKVINKQLLTIYLQNGWEIDHGKEKNWFTIAIKYKNHCVASSQSKYKEFPPKFTIYQ